MNLRKSFQQKLETQLMKWNAEINKLKVKVEKIEQNMKLDYNLQIQSLESNNASAQKILQELGQTEDDVWLDKKNNVENTCKELGRSVRYVVSKFQ